MLGPISHLSSTCSPLTWTDLLTGCRGYTASSPQNNQITFKAIISTACVYWLLNILCHRRDPHLENFGWNLSKHSDNVKGLMGKKSSSTEEHITFVPELVELLSLQIHYSMSFQIAIFHNNHQEREVQK